MRSEAYFLYAATTRGLRNAVGDYFPKPSAVDGADKGLYEC